MTVEKGDASHPRRRLRLAGAALGGVAAAALGVAWLERVPIATGLIDRQLGRSGVAARYTVASLGPGRQRLTDVVIGDPADPDLIADWVETRTALGLGGPYLASVRAGHVRLRARLAGGRLSLGAVDRLLPPGGGGRFALPALDAGVEEALLRLETPYGLVSAKLAGRGRLDNGFRGTIAVRGDGLAARGCIFPQTTALLKVATGLEGVRLTGPLQTAAMRCDGMTSGPARADLEALVGPALDRWSGRALVRAGPVAAMGARVSDAGGTITFAGDTRRTAGRANLRGGRFALPGAAGEALAFDGAWSIGGKPDISGTLSARGVALDRAWRARIVRGAEAAEGTPLAPAARGLAEAAVRAARRFDASADVGMAGIANVSADSASGARLILALSPGRFDGEARLSGGGLPATRIVVRQRAAGAPVSGTATIAPYAGLALAPVAFAGTMESLRLRTLATLSGPLGGGRVERLRAPLAATIGTSGVTLNPGCTPVAFDRVATGSVTLRPAQLTLCALGPALLATRGDRIDHGARIAPLRLEGAIGSSPLTLAADTIRLHGKGFDARGVQARIGSTDHPVALDFAALDGSFTSGAFHGGSGRIGTVPLLLGEAEGTWRFADSALALSGGLTVRDANPTERFHPLAAREVRLRLADGIISVDGELREPRKGVKVADVAIRHVLASGAGSARLAVPGITFGKDFQPEELTPLTYGVIADVKGTIAGGGDIAWDARGVTSTGTFRTAGTDLAAAFGPVTGVKGEIRFTDLLALESAPGQVATIASINPGVPVEGGRIVYQTLAGTRIRVEGARWPFAGGELTLDPATLDFSVPEAHRLTFRVARAEAAQFLQQFDFKNLDATGTFDGMLPIAFDQSGGRIEGGHLVARAGGGGIAYVGELTEKDLGVWGNIAFQALKSLRYRSLDIVMDGPLAGEMVTEVRFAGVSQGEGAKSNFLIRRLQKLPFVFNVRIKAPFRGLLDSVASFYDPRRLIERNLPALIEQQQKRQQQKQQAVQPQESEKMP